MPKVRIQTVLHLLIICVIAFLLRHSGWNWDEGYLLHPDERHMAMVTVALESPDHWIDEFDTDTSTLNPYNQGINSYVYGMLPLKLVHSLTVDRGIRDLSEINRVGRLCSALWSTGTVALLFLFGLRLVSARFATFVSLLMAFTVLAIQQAHFYTVDSAGVFFSTLCVGLGILAVKENRNFLILLSGSTVGLAMACRLNLGLLAFWVMAVALASVVKERKVRPLLYLAGGGCLALLFFRLIQTNAFASTGLIPTGLHPRWLQDVEQVRKISQGIAEVPFTLQWVGKIPYLYALQQLVVWGMGIPLGVVAVGGSSWLLWKHRLNLLHWQALIALWPLILIAYHGRIFLHTLRYFLPVYPLLIVGGALALRALGSVEIKRTLQGLVLGCTALYALAFVNMYKQPHPRVLASKWLLNELPLGGSVVTEHWDDALPLRIKGRESDHQRIAFPQIEVYQPENPQRIRTLLETIDQADYLVLSSTRASYTIPKMPLRYPVMTHFYERLSEGKTRSGLREVARFYRQPHLLGWSLTSLKAEEAYRVYDHPLVRIYEKTPVFDPEALFDVLTKDVSFDQIKYIPYLQANKNNQGWLNPDQIEKRRQDQKWTERFSPESVGNKHPLLIWGLLLWVLGPLSYPYAFYIFPNLKDKGWAVSRLLGLLLISFLAWWPSALGLLPFGSSLLLSSVLFGSTSVFLYALRHEDFFRWFKRKWKLLLWEESILWLIFGIFLILRLLQPDLWHPWAGGEKPMDFAYLNAVVQTPFFPPQNPWLSGAFINYYYYGFVLFACMIRLTGISPDVAYNLALPTIALFTAGGALALSTIFFPWFRSRAGWKGWKAASLLTVGLVLFAGNLSQIREYLTQESFREYWNASRAIRVPAGEVQPITEFPFFSFLYGDLHAHLIALPIAMLCLLSSWQLLRRFHPSRVVIAAALLGTLQVTNTWDVPIQTAVFIFCIFAGARPSSKIRPWIWQRIGWVALGLLVLKGSYAPFHFTNYAYPTEFSLWEGARSSFFDLFLVHGLFIVPLLLGGLILLRSKNTRRAPLRSRLLPLLVFAGCLVTILLLELVSLKGDSGRMNTVFKFYFQLWWIFATLTGTILVSAWGRGNTFNRWFYPAVCSILIGLSLLYALTALPSKLNERFWQTNQLGLNGIAYMDHAEWSVDNQTISLAGDKKAIEWLRSTAAPSSVLLEGQRSYYQWGGRMSWHTGLSSVLGWNWHMQQQRPWPGGPDAIGERERATQEFYKTGNPEIIKRYNVDYIISGELERVTYGNTHRHILDHSGSYSVVYQNQDTRIYVLDAPE